MVLGRIEVSVLCAMRGSEDERAFGTEFVVELMLGVEVGLRVLLVFVLGVGVGVGVDERGVAVEFDKGEKGVEKKGVEKKVKVGFDCGLR